MRLVTPTLSLCALAAAFTAGALTVDPPPRATPPATAVGAAGEPAVITITSFAFTAATAAPGSTVRVVNLDTVAHTVTADDGSFDLFVEPGAEGTFTAPDSAGSFAYTCQVHPAMTGVLTVADFPDQHTHPFQEGQP